MNCIAVTCTRGSTTRRIPLAHDNTPPFAWDQNLSPTNKLSVLPSRKRRRRNPVLTERRATDNNSDSLEQPIRRLRLSPLRSPSGCQNPSLRGIFMSPFRRVNRRLLRLVRMSRLDVGTTRNLIPHVVYGSTEPQGFFSYPPWTLCVVILLEFTARVMRTFSFRAHAMLRLHRPLSHDVSYFGRCHNCAL